MTNKLKIIQKTNKLNIKAVGIKGDNGVSIQSAEITQQNELLLTLTDNSIISAGFITINSSGVQTIQEEFQFTGTEVEFVLAYSTPKAIVTLNGVQQKNITDYQIVGNILTFNIQLEVDDDIIVTYWV